MAAASLSRSLPFLFTLLALLCFTSSQISSDQHHLNALWTSQTFLRSAVEEGLAKQKHCPWCLRKNQKENIHNAEQGLAKLKAERDALYKHVTTLKCFIEPTVALIKKCSEESPDDVLTLKGVMEALKGVMEVHKTQDAQAEWIDANITKLEQDLGKWKTILKALEEYHAEL